MRRAFQLSLFCLVSTIGAFGCGDDDAPADASIGPCATAADCNDAVFCNGPETCDPSDPTADARGCVPGVLPCGDGRCLEAERTCEDVCVDADGDGEGDIACGGSDCNDADPEINAGATEVCDLEGVDEDCDPETFGDRDIDEDGYVDSRCCNGTSCGRDCDETRAGTNPVVPEVCDGRDNDCDGDVDEELLQSVYTDRDRDLHGDPDNPIDACPGKAGTSASMLDCNDEEPWVNTPQLEVEDGLDNDCDGRFDEDPGAVPWYIDADGDRFGDEGTGADTIVSSMVQPGFALIAGDCDDGNPARSPLANELCNGIDDDCDGEANFVIGVNDWEDDDGDGYPDASCASGANADCDDTDPTAHPEHDEVCTDYRDNDCDGRVDEGCGGTPVVDGGVPDLGSDMGPMFCTDEPAVIGGQGSGSTSGPDGFGTASSAATWELSIGAASLHRGFLTLVLADFGNLCGYLDAAIRPTGAAQLVATIEVTRTGSDPDFPAPGTYDFVPNGTSIPEDTPTLREVRLGRFVLPPGSQCGLDESITAGAQTGSLTLDTSTASRVVGSFSYTQTGGIEVDATFDAPVETCAMAGVTPLSDAMFCCTDPATAPAP